MAFIESVLNQSGRRSSRRRKIMDETDDDIREEVNAAFKDSADLDGEQVKGHLSDFFTCKNDLKNDSYKVGCCITRDFSSSPIRFQRIFR